jgi:hypothetical protein
MRLARGMGRYEYSGTGKEFSTSNMASCYFVICRHLFFDAMRNLKYCGINCAK